MNRFIQLTKISLLLCLLSSCAVKQGLKQDFGNTDQIAPKSWSASSAAKSGIDTHWLKQFNDPTLIKLVEKAWKQSPQIQQSSARVTQALALVKVSAVNGRPTADLSFTPARSKNLAFFIDPQNPIANQFNTFNLGLNVGWEPDLWGKFRMGTKAEFSKAEAQIFNLQAAKASLAAQVAKTWFSLKEKNLQIDISNANLQIAEESLAAIKRRYNAGNTQGGGTATNYNNLKIDLLSQQANLSSLKQEKQALSRRLEILTGTYPSGKLDATGSLPTLSNHFKSGLPSELLLRRPDILAAERTYAASRGLVKQAYRAVYPSFPLSGSIGTSSSQLKNVLNSSFGVWSIGANIVQPLLTGGNIKAKIKERKGMQAEALATLHQTVLDAFEEVENGLTKDHALKQQVGYITEAADTADKNNQLVARQFQKGTSDLSTKLNTEAQALGLKSQLSTLQLAHLLNRIDLHLALGGDIKLR